MLNSKNLITKKIMGKSLPNQKLIDLFTHFEEIFKNRKIPPPVNLMEAHFKMIYENFEQDCIESLDSVIHAFKIFEENCGSLFETMTNKKISLINKFDSDFQTIASELKGKYHVILEKSILSRLQDHYQTILIKYFDNKQVLEKEIRSLIKDKDSDKELLNKNAVTINDLNSRLREKDDVIKRKDDTIIEFEGKNNKLKEEKSDVIKEKDKVVEEKNKVIDSVNRQKNLVLSERLEVQAERKRINDKQQTENKAKIPFVSMTIALRNETECIFHLVDQKVLDGVWIESCPYTLLKNEERIWATSSNGLFELSTSGLVKYRCNKCDTFIKISWLVPSLLLTTTRFNATSSNNRHSIHTSGGGGRKVVMHLSIK